MGDEKKFMKDLKNSVDDFITKAMKDFPVRK